MRRDLSTFLDTTYDLLVFGAGTHGACIAWDAALRGLSVAVFDRGDFGAGTSANSLRIVHVQQEFTPEAAQPKLSPFYTTMESKASGDGT